MEELQLMHPNVHSSLIDVRRIAVAKQSLTRSEEIRTATTIDEY